MEITSKSATSPRLPKPESAIPGRVKLDRGSQFAQILNKVTKPTAKEIQPAALAPLVKPRSPLELSSLNKVEEPPKPLPAALEKIGKSRLLISNLSSKDA